jgi:DNA polymerase elongation subunit (family B)
MLQNLNLQKVLFLDIETVPQNKDYSELSENLKKLWDKKAGFIARNEETPEELYERAGIYAEFGKIICISVGFMTNGALRIKSLYGHDEKELLSQFIDLLDRFFSGHGHLLCAHNGKEFDFPYLARRILINHLRLPALLDIAGKKPWEIQHIDTMELWKFGDFKNYTSLDLLAAVFNIPTPKDDIDGSDVARVYYEENNLERIKNYCQKDVIALVQLLRCYRGDPQLTDEAIEEVD